ncbi:MAG: CoA ester lyase, partial [Candidatus Thiodiazotropha sp. (ex Lucinoma borealis)]|nr:CoA ester lyase [Candidatus Thiodiazotropha sp. (ex Lucinoma borealis)]
IHPSQIALANQVFTPGKAEAERARRIIAAMQEAATAGMGAVSLDGRMIDAASIRQAEVVIEKMAQIERITGREAVA